MTCTDSMEWGGLYRKDYDLQTPESMAHPAKMSWDLCFKILDHLKKLGLLREDDTVLDPMAGTGRTAIAACSLDYRAITVELEERFIGFEKANLEYASRKLNRQLDWTILQGDARKLSQLLQERGLRVITSPPYFDSDNKGARAMPLGYWNQVGGVGHLREVDYGATPGQIGNLKDRPLKAVMSPPYGEAVNSSAGGIDWEKAGRPDRLPQNNPAASVQGTQEWRYSKNPQNIGNLPDRPLKVVTSPPYESCDTAFHDEKAGEWYQKKRGAALAQCGESEGNISQERQDTYLEAMRRVYAEIAKVADVLAVVVKNPTRNGQLRRLDLDTIALLAATGWHLVCHHKAILFEEQATATLFGDSHKRPKGRLSFFKRLSYQKGSPVASFEDVIICVKEKEL